jgi:transcriptional regulator with XRE-family HTH domain
MGLLWDIIQQHVDNAPYPPSVRQLAARLKVSPTTVANWREPRDLPARENLVALAELTGRSYDEILDAALQDTGYRTSVQGRLGSIRTPARIRRELSVAMANRADLDELPADLPDTQQLKAEHDARIQALQEELAAAVDGQAVAGQ